MNCRYKIMYDMEFQAIVVAARRSAEWKADIVPYKCGNHWHLTNADPTKRGRHVKPVVVYNGYCEACDQHMRPGRYPKHIKFKRHIKKQEEFDKIHGA